MAPVPKPTRVKALEGNPGRRDLNTEEPQPTGRAVKPEFITGEAAKEWDRALAAMPLNFYSSADVPTLATYCTAWVLYRHGLAQVAREGMVAKGSMGQQVPHPLLGVISQQAQIILRAGDRLGMSPASRARLAVGDDPGESKFAGLIGGRRLLVVK